MYLMLLFFFSLIGLCALIFVFFDLFLFIDPIIKRKGIGKWKNRKEWQNCLENRARKWIKKTPTVRLTNNTRLVLLDILLHRYRNNTIQSWQDAGLIIALTDADCINYLKNHKQVFNDADLKVDNALLAFALKKHALLTEDNNKKIDNLFNTYIKTKQTIPYRNNKDIRYVDSLGLICPYLMLCGYEEIVSLQFSEFDFACDNHGFPSHAYDLSQKISLGPHDWSRGVGWYCLALSFTASVKGNSSRIIKLAYSLLRFQRENGGFGSFIFDKSSQFESSGTSMIGLLMIEAYKLTKDEVFLRSAIKAEKALMAATRMNGELDFCQGDAKGIGKYSELYSIMPFAQGITLLLSKKIDDLI